MIEIIAIAMVMFLVNKPAVIRQNTVVLYDNEEYLQKQTSESELEFLLNLD